METCGRPAKSGHRCKQRLQMGMRACKTHETPEDAAYREGFQDGERNSREFWFKHSEGMRETWIAEGKRQAHLELERAQKDANLRLTDNGRQVVEVDGYAYTWSGAEPLEVGDRVLLPGNWLSSLKSGPGPFSGTVSQIGTSYTGTLSQIIRREALTN